jgi:hypothetical protein
MTDQAELADLVSQIAPLLREGGHQDRAGWLEQRLELLRRPALPSADLERVAQELHGVVLGMGGLMDLQLTPGPASGETSGSARIKLDELADRLYAATR